ncbi:MAG: hypothetical protein AMJ88_13475 [Anaerolineae bacterium SM23_ 63]|nr:MAG: hypothetical protein AMJ88_13475 [Anaerolineae bacterium SM23_ 63]
MKASRASMKTVRNMEEISERLAQIEDRLGRIEKGLMKLLSLVSTDKSPQPQQAKAVEKGVKHEG